MKNHQFHQYMFDPAPNGKGNVTMTNFLRLFGCAKFSKRPKPHKSVNFMEHFL